MNPILPLLLALLPAQVPAAEPPAVHPRRLLLEVRQGTRAGELDDAHVRVGGRVLHDLPQIGWQVVEVARLAEARAGYLAEQAILRVEYDRRKRLAYDPNDPWWPMWHMQRIGADKAWNTHKGAPSVVIGILDTGIEVGHPDLAGNVWTNPGEVPNNFVDDDQNGYIDDVIGWDFAYGDPNPDDQLGHGTSCAGLVAAIQDNGIGVTGVAPRCRVAAIKVGLDSGYLYDSAIVPGLVYSADMGFDVVSMSFYSDGVTPAERAAIDYCWAANVLPVAAAGNDNQVIPYYPGAYENVLSVAATDVMEKKASFSNFGSWVDVAAPGVSLSTVSTGGGYTAGFGGTSGACPHAAGLAGLLFAAKPGATNAEVRAAIEDTAVTLVQAPYGEYTGYGRIDCKPALDRLLGVTSGSKPARMLFAGPVAGGGPSLHFQAARPTKVAGPMRIYGVGFEAPNVVRVLRAGQPLPILERTRNWLVVPCVNAKDVVEVEVGGQVIAAFQAELDVGFAYAPSDACAKGFGNPQANGGFRELYRTDGQLFTSAAGSNGEHRVQFVFRKLEARPVGAIDIEFLRGYDVTNGTETIELYDWSTASYPYGSWVTVQTTPVSGTTLELVQATIGANPLRFLDDEGSLYLQVRTNGGGQGALLRADSLRVRLR
jgi:thermitase